MQVHKWCRYNMRTLDDQERTILRALIKNPRASDNAIAKSTGVPVMSVNRKRKKLEEEGLVTYHTRLNTRKLGIFESQQMYILKLKAGLTKADYLAKFEEDTQVRNFSTKYISSSYLGERDGHLALIFVLNAKNESALVEEFNGKIVPYIQSKLGESAIVSIEAVPIAMQIRSMHNYLPERNMKNGVILPEWSDDLLFVDDA